MKRYLVLLLCIPLLSALVFNTFVAADEAKTLKVGIYDNQPKIFMDNAGQASGFWPDIINYIAAAEGWKIKYIYGTWSDCLQRLEKNEIDIMPDVAYTADREQIYAFSHESVYTSWSRIYTRKGSGIYSILDLEGKKLAVLKGSINVDGPDGIKELIHFYDVNCTLIETESYLSVLSMVQNREADAGVTSKDFGYKNEGDFKVIRTAILLQPSLLYFAYSQEFQPHTVSNRNNR
ncbi:MAG: transporter substrate-binding domain-containing protein [Dehalococcoidia bacterium]|nr:transporter substrate-binding domain-containing protein [Dehalococcoidia bacterium]